VRFAAIAVLAFLAGCAGEGGVRDVPGTAVEATALDGRALERPQLTDDLRRGHEQALAAALADFERNPGADELIWVGRRLAYLGRYRDAIDRFSEGIERFPRDARFLRHRGHRYLTTRQIDLALRDFDAAAATIAGTGDAIEPDGLPNARGIPTSTLHTNIHYHRGLAHYLLGDNAAARDAWLDCLAASRNPDMEAAARYWLYLAQRRLGLADEAAGNLAAVDAGWDIIENTAYHQLLLRFRGDARASSDAAAVASVEDATLAYGLAQWHRFAGRDAEADALLDRLLAGPQWPAFAYLAAEADRQRSISAGAR
jgi:tetratricopeptide (TPR) repeat protein